MLPFVLFLDISTVNLVRFFGDTSTGEDLVSNIIPTNLIGIMGISCRSVAVGLSFYPELPMVQQE